MKRIHPFRHLALKLLALGLALLLWIVVTGEETVERGLRVPLQLQQFPAELELQGEAATTVDVRVRGSSGALGRVSPGDIVAVLDLRSARPGRRLFQLTPEQVRAPFGVEVFQVTPAHRGDGIRALSIAGGADSRRREWQAGARVRGRQDDDRPSKRRGRRAGELGQAGD